MRARLTALFFAPTDARTLGLFRFLYCSSIALSILVDHLPALARSRLAYHPETYHPIRLFELLGIGRLSADAFTALQTAVLAALLAAAFGLMTRWALTASWAGFFLYYGAIHSSMKPPLGDTIGHRSNAVVFVLLILSMAPRIGLWGIDGWLARGRRWGLNPADSPVVSAWPLQAVKLLLALAFFGAAVCKLDGIGWLNGRSLQAIFVEKAMQLDGSPALWLAGQPGLCAALGVFVLIFEASFSVILFYPRLAWVYASGALALHAMILLTSSLDYFPLFAPIYWVVLSYPAPSDERGRLAPGGGRWLTGAFIAALAAVNLAAVLHPFVAWPFSAWNFYGGYRDYREVRAYRLKGVPRAGTPTWLSWADGNKRVVAVSNGIGQALASGRRDWIAAEIAAIVDEMPAAAASGLASVVVVERYARGPAEGPFVFVDVPILEVPVDGETRASSVGEFASVCDRPDAELGHSYAPGCSGWRVWAGSRAWMSYNSLGLRDKDYAARPAPGVVRVLATGGSIITGSGLAESEAPARALERGLRGRGLRSEVVNAASEGYTGRQNAVALKALLKAYSPQAVVYYLPQHHVFTDRSLSPDPRVRAWESWRRVLASWRLALRRDPGARLDDLLSPTLVGLRRMRENSRESGARFFVAYGGEDLDAERRGPSRGPGSWARLLEGLLVRDFRVEGARLEERLRREGFELLSLARARPELESPENRLRGDYHWNARGAVIFGESVAEEFVRTWCGDKTSRGGSPRSPSGLRDRCRSGEPSGGMR